MFRRRRARERRAFILGYAFPEVLRRKVAEELPGLTWRQVDGVLEGLRVWFLGCLQADGRVIGMPSRAVDVAWHGFILITPEYHAVCERAFGRYLHHRPGATMDEDLAGPLARTAVITTSAVTAALVPDAVGEAAAAEGRLVAPPPEPGGHRDRHGMEHDDHRGGQATERPPQPRRSRHDALDVTLHAVREGLLPRGVVFGGSFRHGGNLPR